MYRVLGIDPGKKGGFVVLDWCEEPQPLFNPIDSYKMPLQKNGRIDAGRIQEIIIENNIRYAAVEKQVTLSKQKGNLTIGRNYGYVLAALDLCAVKFSEVHPGTWQSFRNDVIQSYVDGLPDETDNKEKSVLFCQLRGFPVPMTSSHKNARPFDGIADAWGIAYWFANEWLLEGVPPIK